MAYINRPNQSSQNPHRFRFPGNRPLKQPSHAPDSMFGLEVEYNSKPSEIQEAYPMPAILQDRDGAKVNLMSELNMQKGDITQPQFLLQSQPYNTEKDWDSEEYWGDSPTEDKVVQKKSQDTKVFKKIPWGSMSKPPSREPTKKLPKKLQKKSSWEKSLEEKSLNKQHQKILQQYAGSELPQPPPTRYTAEGQSCYRAPKPWHSGQPGVPPPPQYHPPLGQSGIPLLPLLPQYHPPLGQQCSRELPLLPPLLPPQYPLQRHPGVPPLSKYPLQGQSSPTPPPPPPPPPAAPPAPPAPYSQGQLGPTQQYIGGTLQNAQRPYVQGLQNNQGQYVLVQLQNPQGQIAQPQNPQGQMVQLQNPQGQIAQAPIIQGSIVQSPQFTQGLNTQGGLQYVQPQPQGQFVQAQPQGQFVQAQPQGQFVQAQPQGQFVQSRPQGQFVQSQPQGQFVQPQPQGQFVQAQPQGQANMISRQCMKDTPKEISPYGVMVEARRT